MKFNRICIALLSLVPPIGLPVVAIVETIVRSIYRDALWVSELADYLLLGFGVLILVMLLYYCVVLLTTSDSRVDGKRGQWVVLLLLLNVFAVPLAWMLLFGLQPDSLRKDKKVPGSN